jgi:hypothetical protein
LVVARVIQNEGEQRGLCCALQYVKMLILRH